MPNPLITIVTPTFNIIKNGREEMLRQSIESVHNQTYENIEHIIIDGASQDGTLDLIKEYVDKGWVKLVSAPDDGLYDAMNKGCRIAHGKYVAILNSDDFYHNNAGIEYCVKKLEMKMADFCYSPIKMLNGSCVSKCKYPKMLKLLLKMPVAHPSLLIKKSVFEQIGGYDTQFKIIADADFILQLFLGNFKSVFVDQDFITFREGGISFQNINVTNEEWPRVYYKEYNSICDISMSECEQLYKQFRVPQRLIWSLLKGKYSLKIKISALFVSVYSLKKQCCKAKRAI